MAERVYNFSAGPAMMPVPVLEQAGQDLINWNNSGMGVGEMSHRSDEFQQITAEAETDFRDLLAIPDNYKVLFLQGGATGQFSAVPMNLTERNETADYVITGSWSEKAQKIGQRQLAPGGLHLAASAETYTYVPDVNDWDLLDYASY